jgi:hypothetical protein
MARTIKEIYNQMLASKNAESSLSGLNSNSQTAIYNLWLYIVAAATNITEQLNDAFKSDVETIVKNNYVGTPKWIKSMVFSFQYDAASPQILVYDEDTFKVNYSVVNPDLRIITRCAVSADLNKNVNIKVARLEPPAQLASGEDTALQAYLTEIMPAGITFSVINSPSDKLYIAGTVYYDGAYSGTIQDNVELAINNYLANIDFDGAIKIIDLQIAIRNVAGVSDLDLDDVWLRTDSLPLANGFKMIEDSTLKILSAVPNAGYAVEEDTSGETWADKINYVMI